MKTLKFRAHLVPLVLSGEKNITWRLFDDKNLVAGDEVELWEYQKNEKFGVAQITEVIEKPFSELDPKDKLGYEKFSSDVEMYETYSSYYGTQVTKDTLVKVIIFKVL